MHKKCVTGAGKLKMRILLFSLLGVLCFTIMLYAQEEEFLNIVILEEPSWVYKARGDRFFREGKFGNALAQYKKALIRRKQEGSYQKIDGIDIEMGLSRQGGNLDIYLKKLNRFRTEHEETSDHVERALRESRYEVALSLIQRVQRDAFDIGAETVKEDAEALFEEVIEYDHENEIANFQLGLLYAENKNYDDAMEAFLKVWGSNPSHGGSMLNLALVYGHKGDFDRAKELIKSAYETVENMKDGFARLGWIKATMQDWSGALEIMNRDLTEGRISPGHQINLAQLYGQMGDFDCAVKLIRQAYGQDRNLKDGYAKLGIVCCLFSGDSQNLQFCIDKDRGLNRLSSQGELIRSLAMSIDGSHISACKLMELLYHENDDLKNGFAILGWLRIEHGFTKEGLVLMGKDYQLGRLASDWLVNYIYQLVMEGEFRTAKLLFNELSELEPYQHEFRIGFQLSPVRVMLRREFEQMLESESL